MNTRSIRYQFVELAGYDHGGTVRVEKKKPALKVKEVSTASTLLPAVEKLLNFVYNSMLLPRRWLSRMAHTHVKTDGADFVLSTLFWRRVYDPPFWQCVA